LGLHSIDAFRCSVIICVITIVPADVYITYVSFDVK
jgi:hypothetical protein